MFEKIAHFRAASIGHWQLYTMAITTLCHAIVSFHNMNKAKSLLNFDGSMFSYCHACFQILHSSKLTQQLPYMRTCRQSCCQKPKLKLPFRPLTAEFSGRENLVHIRTKGHHSLFPTKPCGWVMRWVFQTLFLTYSRAMLE